jgi:NTE family protein
MTTTTPQPTANAAPPRSIPADLVLEGGGVKGIGLVGAVLELANAGYKFKRIAGTSAGAIVASILAALDAAGKPLTDVQGYLNTINYSKFMEKGRLRSALGIVGDAEHLVFHAGEYDGNYLNEWLGDVLQQIGITHFGDLKTPYDPQADPHLTEQQRYSLVVHASDITRSKLVRLPWEYGWYGLDADHQRIVDAVRASMSIPFFFEPVRFRAPAATLDGTACVAGEVTWVDGGLLDNFPVDVFDRTDGAPERWETIGIKLSAKAPVITSTNPANGVVNEAIACLRTLLDNADRYYVTPDRAARTIFVDNAGVKATDFHLTPQDQTQLFNNGQAAAHAWIASRQPAAGGT